MISIFIGRFHKYTHDRIHQTVRWHADGLQVSKSWCDCKEMSWVSMQSLKKKFWCSEILWIHNQDQRHQCINASITTWWLPYKLSKRVWWSRLLNVFYVLLSLKNNLSCVSWPYKKKLNTVGLQYHYVQGNILESPRSSQQLTLMVKICCKIMCRKITFYKVWYSLSYPLFGGRHLISNPS